MPVVIQHAEFNELLWLPVHFLLHLFLYVLRIKHDAHILSIVCNFDRAMNSYYG